LSHSRSRLNKESARLANNAARVAITLSALVSIAALLAILCFLLLNSFRAVGEVGLWEMLSGTIWRPTSSPPAFGFLPAESGSLWVTLIAIVCAMPVGVGAAVCLSEFVSGRVREVAKSLVECIATVPSVALGLLGMTFLVPWIRTFFSLPSGLTALAAGLMVGVLCLPTIVSISEDALTAVPDALRQGSLAMGNTKWQTAVKIVVPAAWPGIFAAILLGFGRAVGETMVVLMIAGNSGLVVQGPFEAARTLPGTIAGEVAEVVRGGLHYSALFAMALVLFLSTFVVNLIAAQVIDRSRRRWSR